MAFFDLDRTLLQGGSGPVISEALRSVGIGRTIPGEGAFYRIYELLGETRPAMIVTRQVARFAAGWPLDAVREAGALAGESLAATVQPYARPLFEEHRGAGRLLVLATTTPYELVRPLADALGFDDVIATRYGERDGAYDGTIVGDFVWGSGKLQAVRAWSETRGVDLGESWAYSDSWYDLPLLEAVGHPHAVNPDARLSAIALLRRWPIVYLDKPPGVPKLFGLVEPQRLLQMVARPELMRFVRFDIDGVENIPPHGPAILVSNHRSYFDPVTIGVTLARRGRALRFLTKKELFDVPLAGPVLRAMGGHRGRQGHRLGRAAPSRRGGGPGRRAGGHPARGHHPARRGLLRSGAEGPHRGGPAGRRHPSPGDPARSVGDRAGLAPQLPVAQPDQRLRPADGAGAGGPARRCQAPVGPGRHQADHGRHLGPAAARGGVGRSAHRRGAGPYPAAGMASRG